MKLLVTGGAGFIGSEFIRYWMQHHHEDKITNLDLLTYAGNLENLKEVEENPNYNFVKGDICDRDLVFDLVKDVDLVVHFAAESHVDRSVLDSSAFLRTNILGTQTLLDAVKEYGKRFHHVSTDEVFGSLQLDDPAFDESTPYAPRNPYSASKAASDHLVRSYHITHGIKMTISNCSNNYGPYHFPEKMIPLFISNLMEDKTVPVYGDGDQIRDWIYVTDHVRGIEAVIEKGKIGETYCLGGKDAEVTNLELTKTMIKLLGKSEDLIEFVKDRPGHDRRYAINYAKAQKELGWEPLVGLEEGIQNTIDWFESHKEWADRCRSGEYQEYYNKQYHS
ncbi:dTDP-glucose 4,6-dehydratase [Candidatus Parcubacteria bacterium]|nr:MAG: dTDP-glucose 4,6-dehydratase [Candidatus Parcubacteria bacterium]